MPGWIHYTTRYVCICNLCWRVVPKTVTGLVPVGVNPDSPSDVIVASWIKGGERVRVSYCSLHTKQTGKLLHRPGMVCHFLAKNGRWWERGATQHILCSSVHHPNIFSPQSSELYVGKMQRSAPRSFFSISYTFK